MLLSPEDAELFFKLHRALMFFVNQRLDVVSDIGSPDEFAALLLPTRLEVREAFLEEVDLIESFVDENPASLNEKELEIVSSWHDHVTGKFYLFRQLKNYMVFLSSEEVPVAYGVLALTEPFEDVIGPRLPVMVDAMLLPFRDCIIYDGLLGSYNVSFGGGPQATPQPKLPRSERAAGNRDGTSHWLTPRSSTKDTQEGKTQSSRIGSGRCQSQAGGHS